MLSVQHNSSLNHGSVNAASYVVQLRNDSVTAQTVAVCTLSIMQVVHAFEELSQTRDRNACQRMNFPSQANREGILGHSSRSTKTWTLDDVPPICTCSPKCMFMPPQHTHMPPLPPAADRLLAITSPSSEVSSGPRKTALALANRAIANHFIFLSDV